MFSLAGTPVLPTVAQESDASPFVAASEETVVLGDEAAGVALALARATAGPGEPLVRVLINGA